MSKQKTTTRRLRFKFKTTPETEAILAEAKAKGWGQSEFINAVLYESGPEAFIELAQARIKELNEFIAEMKKTRIAFDAKPYARKTS